MQTANRIAAVWAAFTKHKAELCFNCFLHQERLSLFDAVVIPAVLYACSTWALTQSIAIRRMLRFVFRIFPKRIAVEDEDSVDLLHRPKHEIEEHPGSWRERFGGDE